MKDRIPVVTKDFYVPEPESPEVLLNIPMYVFEVKDRLFLLIYLQLLFICGYTALYDEQAAYILSKQSKMAMYPAFMNFLEEKRLAKDGVLVMPPNWGTLMVPQRFLYNIMQLPGKHGETFEDKQDLLADFLYYCSNNFHGNTGMPAFEVPVTDWTLWSNAGVSATGTFIF